MKVLAQDRNWLKIIGIVVILFTTLQLSQCSRSFTHRSEANARVAVQVICQNQIYNYNRSGQFLQNIEAQGLFTNAYPEFYAHSTRYVGNQAFHYATSKSPYLKSYVGLVVGLPKAAQLTTASADSAIATLCEATKPGATAATDPSFHASTLVCGSQTQQIGDLLTLR